MKEVQKSVTKLLEAQGVEDIDDMEINENYEFNGGDLHYNLVIEKVYENTLSVEQYFTQRMDRMSAPEVRFDTSGPDWTPIEYTNHETTPQIYERNEAGVDGLDQLLETWGKNLESQFSEYLEDSDH